MAEGGGGQAKPSKMLYHVAEMGISAEWRGGSQSRSKPRSKPRRKGQERDAGYSHSKSSPRLIPLNRKKICTFVITLIIAENHSANLRFVSR